MSNENNINYEEKKIININEIQRKKLGVKDLFNDITNAMKKKRWVKPKFIYKK